MTDLHSSIVFFYIFISSFVCFLFLFLLSRVSEPACCLTRLEIYTCDSSSLFTSNFSRFSWGSVIEHSRSNKCV